MSLITEPVKIKRPHQWAEFYRTNTPREIRSMLEFAEQEIVIPQGPYRGNLYTANTIPWHRELIDTMDSGRFSRIIATGSRQSSKTLTIFDLPYMYHTFEQEEDVICGIPSAVFAQAIWEERILPMINNSQYKRLLPERGPGSKGGAISDYVTFKNGVTTRFLTEGYSFSARVILFTEIYRLKTSGSKGKEAGAFFSVEECASSFDSDKRVYGESITTTGLGQIYTEVKNGTDTYIYLRCPYCGCYILPERSRLLHWREAENVIEAEKKARYSCQECEGKWNEADRQKAIKDYKFIHKGQGINKKGKITGPEPEEYTDTLGIQWGRMHSSLNSLGAIAKDEWRAEYNPPKEWEANPQKAIHNYVWGIPYIDDLMKLPRMAEGIILNRINKFKKGEIPEHSEKTALFIDVGKYICWYTIVSFWGKRIGAVVEYGQFTVPQDIGNIEIAIESALMEFWHTAVLQGWKKGDEVVIPDLTFVDAGYEPKAVYNFILKADPQQVRLRASVGEGSSERKTWSSPKKYPEAKLRHWFPVRQPNGIILIHMNSDYWKEQVHSGFFAPVGTPGSLTVHHVEEPREHISFARQISAERKETNYSAGGKESIKWVRGSAKNHYFDCNYGCIVIADMLEIRLSEPEDIPPPPQMRNQNKKKSKWISRGRGWNKR